MSEHDEDTERDAERADADEQDVDATPSEEDERPDDVVEYQEEQAEAEAEAQAAEEEQRQEQAQGAAAEPVDEEEVVEAARELPGDAKPNFVKEVEGAERIADVEQRYVGGELPDQPEPPDNYPDPADHQVGEPQPVEDPTAPVEHATGVERVNTEARDSARSEAGIDGEPHSADPLVRSKLGTTEADLAQPFRNRSVAEDTVPLNTHEEYVNPATGFRSDVVERYHKPGYPLPETQPQIEPEERARERELQESIDADKLEAGDVQRQPDTPAPEHVYAGRSNIVQPGPTLNAAAAAAVAAGVEYIPVDPELVRYELDEGETAHDKLRDELDARRDAVLGE